MTTPRQSDDGGPAFPKNHHTYPNGDMEYGSHGMSLRDWFAGQALVGLRTHEWETKDSDIARWAYEQADAMIAARKEAP